jgi:hypothetical protein
VNGERDGSGGVNDYVATASATLCCLLISQEAVTCSSGSYTYTFTVTNFSNQPISGFFFTPTTANVTITPSTFNTQLQPGASATVTVSISGSGAVSGANVCFFTSLFAAAVVCRVEHCLTLPQCCVAPPAGMVAWYPLNEGQGATVVNDIAPPPASLVNNTGTPQPAAIGAPFAPFSTTGVVGTALFFGGSFVEVQPQSELNFGSFSIDGWIRPVQCNATLPATVVDKFDTGTNTGFVFFAGQPTLGTAVLELRLNSSVFSSTGTFAPSTWVHAAVTVDTSTGTGTFYINGAPAGTFTVPAGSIINTATMRIGRTRVTTAICELGIDELEIFNRALTLAELKSIYSAGPAGKCIPLRRRAAGH